MAALLNRFKIQVYSQMILFIVSSDSYDESIIRL